MNIDNAVAERHKQRMQHKKSVIDARIAKATEQRGVVILLKGTGKGKSSSAFGTALRALGHGQKVGIVQFIKGKWECGEQRFLQPLPDVTLHVMGQGFTWETQDRQQDLNAAHAAWECAQNMLHNSEFDLIILDEITYMFKYDLLSTDQVIAALKTKPVQQNVILTGRTAPPEIEAIADTVSEVRNIKHAFSQGVKAQPGIEW